MAGKISMGARREVVSVVTERYRSAKRAEKGRILDELCATTGWHRKHAVRALRRREAVGPGEVEATRKPAGHFKFLRVWSVKFLHREAGQGTVSLSLFPGQELQRLL
ncbi:hypothetical protein [Bradyrhizobium japonicum]|uniref:hypothetical protein n=1 Tax=Bradyrhizobium japonicum TaxID=375 RepID=UPI00200FECDE|nr:hypothetical protein [Bradyrhizobium japonicum]UQE03697.1 hypothetical protein JEY30_46485 [Bradyrhizobium japonicum]